MPKEFCSNIDGGKDGLEDDSEPVSTTLLIIWRTTVLCVLFGALLLVYPLLNLLDN